MNKRLLILLVSQILVLNYVIGQNDFRNGYIITQNHDSIFGKINNRNYYDNSQFCDIKVNSSDSLIRYYPHNLFGYRFIDGKYYITKEINSQKVFMEYLIKGKLDIYFYQNEKGVNKYYVSKDSLPLSELKYSSEVKDVNGIQMLSESKPFIQVLTYYTSDCPSLREDIPKLSKPDHRNLIKLSKEYQSLTCKDEECIVYEKTLKNKIKLGFYAGSNITFGNLPNTNYTSWGFNLLFQQSERRERIYLGLGFFNEGKIVDDPDTFFHTPMSKSGKNYRIPLSINYIHPKSGFSPTFSYQLNLNRLTLQNLDCGLKYQYKYISISLIADLKTEMFVNPFGAALLFGLTFDL